MFVYVLQGPNEERGTESEQFFDELENLLQSNPGSKVIIDTQSQGQDEEAETQEDEIEYVYFHTSEMGQDFEKLPDVLVADFTYCTNKYDMPLMVFLCLDSNGNGRAAGYCLLRDEQKSTVRKAVTAFSDAHPCAPESVRTVIVDKDYNERSVIAEVFPDAVIHICLSHTLQIFKRNTVSEPNRDEVRDLLEKMAYSNSQEGII